MPPNSNSTYVALDIGDARIGVALATVASRLAHPFKTLQRSTQTIDELKTMLATENAVELIIGLPRNMSGQETAQTEATRRFAKEIQAAIELPVKFQDETLTSVKAKEELDGRGVAYNKGDVDALAATYILEDYLKEGVH